MSPDELTDTDKAIIDIWAKAWQFAGHREQAIRDATGLSDTAATQRLAHLLNTEAALVYDAVTINRLRRIRDERPRRRTCGTKGATP